MKVFIHVVDITCFEEVPYEVPYTELWSDYDIVDSNIKFDDLSWLQEIGGA